MQRSILRWMGLMMLCMTLPAVAGAGTAVREAPAVYHLRPVEGSVPPAPARLVGGELAGDDAARPAFAHIGGDTLPDAAAAIARAHRESNGRPESAVWTLIDAFERMDIDGYLAALAEGYHFDSDDPSFRAAVPQGFDTAGERAFLTHLFRGGGHAPDGSDLPVAVRVEETLGPMRVSIERGNGARATAHIEHLRVQLTFADGSTTELGDTDNELELVLGESGWRVRRWHEKTTHGEPDAGLAHAAKGERPASTVDIPARLAMSARGEPATGLMRFDVALPSAGGTLELFDVMGRRLKERDLATFAPGRHVVTFDAIAIPAGVYWARVRQGGEAASARVVWIH